MGRANDTSAVVDSAGRVLGGISGLRVVDASVMPVLPPGQPMSTVCEYYLASVLRKKRGKWLTVLDMIAEKLADSILSDKE